MELQLLNGITIWYVSYVYIKLIKIQFKFGIQAKLKTISFYSGEEVSSKVTRE